MFCELKRNSFKCIINAIVPISRRNIYSIDEYYFSYKLHNYYKYAAAEDTNIASICRIQDSLKWIKQFDELVMELIEYFILNIMMDSELKSIDSKNLVRYNREDLKDFVLHNRFFKLFTEDTKYRVAFDNRRTDSNVYASFSNGAMYEKIELYFPKNCKLIKNNNSLVIDSEYFVFDIKIDFSERLFSSSKFQRFVKWYDKENNISHGSAKITIEFKPKIKYLFSFSNDISYYLWIDECVSEIIKKCSIDEFFKQINWDSVEMLLKCSNLK